MGALLRSALAMSNYFAKVGEVEYISSGTIVAANIREAVLFPFSPEDGYKIVLNFIFDDENPSNVQRVAADPVTIELRRPWANGDAHGFVNVSIASIGDYVYYINGFVDVVGNPENYILSCSYSIIRSLKGVPL